MPEAALRDLGAGPVARFVYGTLPLIAAQCLGYTLYRWEMNIRMATILGFVGGGGLGQLLYFHLSLFQQAQAATVLAAMTMLVLADDALSGWARRALERAGALTHNARHDLSERIPAGRHVRRWRRCRSTSTRWSSTRARRTSTWRITCPAR